VTTAPRDQVPHAHGDRGSLEPPTQLTAALLLSLALWAPSGLATLDGQLDLVAAGIRYLIAFVGCRFAVGGIAYLLDSYHAAHDDDASKPAPAGPIPQRRSADQVADAPAART
jgi:hypothetical protein